MLHLSLVLFVVVFMVLGRRGGDDWKLFQCKRSKTDHLTRFSSDASRSYLYLCFQVIHLASSKHGKLKPMYVTCSTA